MTMSHKREFTLGIYGDGQLAGLIASSALESNISVIIYSLDKEISPCKNIAPLKLGKSWHDEKSFFEFCDLCETVVLENEFVPFELVLLAEKNGTRFFPNAESYAKVSHKLKQVELSEHLGIKIPDYKVISKASDLENISLPVMLKSLTGGYDGYGNFAFTDLLQMDEAKFFIDKVGTALAQEFLHFEKEVAVIVVSDGKSFFTFPVVETIQDKSICHFVLTPPRFSNELQEKIKNQAIQLIKAISGIGVFGVEFFKMGEEIIFNEIAPRTHNSGHYTIEACDYSQFDGLIKLILNQPLTPPQLKTEAAGMLNLLGTQNGKANFQGNMAFHNNPQGFLHLYGKEDSRIGRKMGHFTLLGHNQDELFKELSILKSQYQL
jgi:5-(carboxyamino)imidazole ribonucleotide synthase